MAVKTLPPFMQKKDEKGGDDTKMSAIERRLAKRKEEAIKAKKK